MPLTISEIFYSVQGEGLLTGMPSVFIRTSGCNLRCTWCDTPYTSWRPEGERWEIPQILAEAEALVGRAPSRYAVLTGGEPMLFPEAVELTKVLRAAGFHITVETAGTVYQPVACDLMSISPKLANSTPHHDAIWGPRHERLRIQPEVLGRLQRDFACQWKFVLAGPEDLAEVEAVLAQLPDRPAPGQVLLMPEGRSGAEINERSLALVEVAKQCGYRLSTRLHVYLWGDQRGV
ncbi:MAG: 7-carboxy-7-deazaguanine synthase QueE [Bryobacter sp.]